ncbi:hypothetical protein HDU77_001088, partial [Chytriomyces hyalinus]
MPLTNKQKSQVCREVDEAGLVNQRSCIDRITALSAAFECDIATVKNYISNHRQKKRKAADVAVLPAVGSESTHIQQLEANPSIPAYHHELNDIVVPMPRKVRIVASEQMPGYQMFLRDLGKELKDANKALKKDDSQAKLLQINEFQMVTSDSGVQIGSKWAALSQNERDEYAARAHSQMLVSKENVDSTGGSIAEIQEAQRKAYSNMLAGIRNFVKTRGTHIGTSRLPYELDDNHRIVTVAAGDLAKQTMRQAAKAAIQYQPVKVLQYLDLRQRMEKNASNSAIIARPKNMVGPVHTRRTTFQGDLLRKYQKFNPQAKRVPLKELREGKIHGVRLMNWPSSVTKCANFNEKELEIL